MFTLMSTIIYICDVCSFIFLQFFYIHGEFVCEYCMEGVLSVMLSESRITRISRIKGLDISIHITHGIDK